MYYGDELGLRDVAIPADKVVDPRELREPGKGLGRDPVRSPMPWTPKGGFTTGSPWLPMNFDRAVVNVETESDDDGSMLNFYKLLLAIRRNHPSLTVGSIALEPLQGDVLIYRREHGNEKIRVALNFSNQEQIVQLKGDRMIFSTHMSAPHITRDTVTLRPNEAVIIEA
jgi:alpha-glucosidase